MQKGIHIMRQLVLLRGSPACGKSTFITTHNLEPYALSADTIRLQYCSPALSINGDWAISQRNDKIVWDTLFKMLEVRMQNGCFTVVDATNSKTAEMNRYKELCQKYRYRIMCVDMTDVPIEVCKERNSKRAEYKRVPEEVIDNMYSRFATQNIPSGIRVVKPEEFEEAIQYTPMDLSEYDAVYVIGDIHGAKQPLDDFNNDIFNHGGKKNFFIFCGDYIDRGTQNAEVLDFLYGVKDNKNVLLLEGNHEKWISRWANDEDVTSKEFVNYTLPQLEQAKFTKKQAREFYRKLGQCCYFTYDNETFFVCHGGISRVPINPIFVPTIQMVDGVGRYSDYKDVADTFSQHKSNNYATYLINGHRNINDFNTEVNNYCYNLEGKVEFGGNLRVVRIGKGEEIKCLEYLNKLPIAEHLAKRETNFVSDNVTTDDTNFEGTAEELEIRNLVRTFRKSKYVVEKQFGNISSFNFSRQAFNEKIWTDSTTKARGLYIDTLQNKIFCRGYEKFFKINETEETKLPTLARNLQFPVTVYQKENGYLGLISYDYYNDDLFFTTKSTPDGDYAVHFKNLFKCMVKNTQRDFLKQFLKDCKSTLAVEVIDPLFDPHIIKYTKSKIVCLDLIKNSLEFAKFNYTILQNLANALELDCKVHIQTINNWECFENFIDRAAKHSDRFSDNGEHIEGWVLEDNSGYMTKLKSNYYNVWKGLRGAAYSTIKSGHYRYTGSLQHPMQNYFYGWLKKNWEHYHYNDTVPKDIISLREDFIKDNPHFAESDYY
jgi:predicted kinase